MNADSKLGNSLFTATVRRGDYDEFTDLAVSSYGRAVLIDEMIKVLGEEFWNFVLELNAERQDKVLETLRDNSELVFSLLENGKEDSVLGLIILPAKFKIALKDAYLLSVGKLLVSDPRRLLIAREYKNGNFLEQEELKDLAAKVKDEEVEYIFASLSAKQILVFAKALPLAKLLNLPNIVKRATVLAQVKSVICAETEADPKLKEICTTGKWAVIRTFGVKN